MKKPDRRDFLKVSAISGVGIMGTTIVRANNNSEVSAIQDASVFEEKTISELQEVMKTGKLTAQDLTQKYIDRIKEIDGKLNSVIEINLEAMKIAEDLDKERQKGKIRGALHGIPILLKDNIDTADKMQTTAGSLALLMRRRLSRTLSLLPNFEKRAQ